MTEQFLMTRERQDHDLIGAVNHSAFNGLLSDEVVMQWLLDLEAEDLATDLDEARRQGFPRRLND